MVRVNAIKPAESLSKGSITTTALQASLVQGNEDGRTLAAKRARMEAIAAGSGELALVPVAEIMDRADQDTRVLKPFDLIDTAYSIREVGLICPVALDSKRRLMAGGHRLASHRLMICEKPEDREITFRQMVGRELDSMTARKSSDQREAFKAEVDELYRRVRDIGHHSSRSMILARLYPEIDSTTDEGREQALAIEATENTRRRAYTDGELRKIAERFKGMGYAENTHGPKNLYSALGFYTSLSLSSLRRKLGTASNPNAAVLRMKRGDLTKDQLLNALKRFLERLPVESHGALPQAIADLERLPAEAVKDGHMTTEVAKDGHMTTGR